MMILTPNYWISHAKNTIDNQFVDAIIRDDIFISLQKLDKTYHTVQCCLYKGSNFDSFFKNTLNTIKNRLQELQIKDALGLNWLVRPTDEPNNLKELLKEKGFVKLHSIYKMGLDLQTSEKVVSADSGDYEVVQGPKEMVYEDQIANLILDAFPSGYLDIEDVKRKFRIAFERLDKNGDKREDFIVYTKSEHKPVAGASLFFNNKISNAAYLNGALTAKEYRHKGIYTAILSKRIQRCQELGLRYITVDSDQDTSGPILKKFGFKVFDPIEVYRLDRKLS